MTKREGTHDSMIELRVLRVLTLFSISNNRGNSRLRISQMCPRDTEIEVLFEIGDFDPRAGLCFEIEMI
jgi:hypothetical protein